MKPVLLIVGLLCAVALQAQDKNSVVSDPSDKSVHQKLSFHSINQIGLLEGEKGSSVALQTINGLRYKTWFAGIGTGLDYYSFRTIPLFADVRKNLFAKPKSPFVYVDAGVNFPWKKKDDPSQYYYSNNKYKSGYYFDAGAGYSIETKRSGAFVLSLGYSIKKFAEQQDNYIYPTYVDYAPNVYAVDIVPTPAHYDFYLRRFAIKVGWMF